MEQTDAVEEAAFLVRSPHRIEVLRRLREGPSTRPDLAEAAAVSRVTLGRSLGELENRGWIERAGRDYRLTALGEFVLSATDAFLDAMGTQRRLGDVAELLPVADLGFDLRRLRDASVVRSSRHDTGEAVRRYLELVRTASEIRVLKDTVEVSVVAAISDRIEAEELAASVVYSPGAVAATKRIPEAREAMLRDLENGKAAFVSPGRLTHHLAVVDGTVLLFLLDDGGVRGLVETDDGVVREWALETFERVRDEADRLDPSELLDDG